MSQPTHRSSSSQRDTPHLTVAAHVGLPDSLSARLAAAADVDERRRAMARLEAARREPYTEEQARFIAEVVERREPLAAPPLDIDVDTLTELDMLAELDVLMNRIQERHGPEGLVRILRPLLDGSAARGEHEPSG